MNARVCFVQIDLGRIRYRIYLTLSLLSLVYHALLEPTSSRLTKNELQVVT